MGAASETAATLIESLQKEKVNLAVEALMIFQDCCRKLFGCYYLFFVRYQDGKYSDMPHVLAF